MFYELHYQRNGNVGIQFQQASLNRGQDYWGVNGVYIEPTYRNPTRASGYIN
jgi:hypothetical protein